MPTAATGRILAGRYRLISELGVGGMGVTYRAWDDVNGMPVVVKMPKREAQSDEEALRRFAREIDAMLALPHEHIVPITDHGDDDGCPYVVMRFLPGGSLADHRRRDDDGNPLANPAGMLHFWLPAIAEALDHIHQRGMLHRDVKPGNIFFDGFWNAFLGDFGIAKVVDSSGGLAKEQTITATMVAIGTPEYMAPELFSPKAKPDGRADQYALAVTVYEMLCGVRPFTGSKAHIVVEHSGMQVPPLQNKGLSIPESLCVAVERALEKKPAERFSTCSDFVRAALRDVTPLIPEQDVTRLLCPGCKNLLKLPQRAAGRTGRCPKCREPIDVAEDLGSLWLKSEERGAGTATAKQSLPPLDEPLTQASKGAIWRWGMLALTTCCGLALGYAVGAVSQRAKMQAQLTQSQDSLANVTSDKAELERTLVKRDAELAAALAAKTSSPEEATADTEADQARSATASGSENWQVLTNSIGMELKLLPAGTFTMSYGGEKPHQVTLTKPFCIGVHEVTNSQWQRVMRSVPSNWKDDDRPVEQVRWDDAVDFCQKLSALPAEKSAGHVYRLPTEAEWEYACRAGTTTAYSFGDDVSLLGDFAWFDGNSGEQTHPVGQKKPNAWGLYDMHGNVWEWCSDRYGRYPEGEVMDPPGPSSGSTRVVRGGSWGYAAGLCGSAFRYGVIPPNSQRSLGFRLALSPSGSSPPEAGTSSEPRLGENQAEPATGAAEAEQASSAAASGSDKWQVLTNSIGIKLKLIPAGTFVMESGGRSLYGTAPQVTLTKPFYIGVHEVTNSQWQRVMGSVPSRWKDDDRPVEQVSWDDAVDFCQKLSALPAEKSAGLVYRLPSRAEWEYACRAGTTTKYSFGDDESLLGDFGWFDGNSTQTHPVGQKKPNAWGLYDVHGNVWEWCSDRVRTLRDKVPLRPVVGWTAYLQGGSWYDSASSCRLDVSRTWCPNEGGIFLGFRLALSPSGSSPPEAGTSSEPRLGENQAEPATGAAEAEQASSPAVSGSDNWQVLTNSVGIKLKLLPTGTFVMGENRPHQVTLTQPFFIGVYEVTNTQWQQVMGSVPSEWKDGGRPVETVSWEDAVDFCQKLSKLPAEKSAGRMYRLPTEAEWEYACRAGTTTAYSFGDNESLLGGFAWFARNSGKQTHPVGQKKPNAWGLYDMHGNVEEWCSDWWGDYPGGEVTNPQGPSSGSTRVLRGGSWNFSARFCRSALRPRVALSGRDGSLGFRLALSPSGASEKTGSATLRSGETLRPDKAVTWEKNGHAYQVFRAVLPWPEAKKRCEEMGGHLVSITSPQEQKFVCSLIAQSGIPVDRRSAIPGQWVEWQDKFWLGGTDEGSEGRWRWVDGSPWEYALWAPKQPDGDGDFLNICPHLGGSWNDGPAKAFFLLGFICEWPDRPTAAVPKQ